ncbi:hypothetical protein GCM10010211_76180 [Streptomyces albospinus]|uniref:Transposase n=1 Tax=Streptomyces albospinus TaxID=285515 RepID=A0ABQ2VLY9_9ACTN|nr:hypothetical protein [Streptomyces albospinus]GGU97667.1 hypothetical protein GCM10010211_76180 [Streptomyces albospinus]
MALPLPPQRDIVRVIRVIGAITMRFGKVNPFSATGRDRISVVRDAEDVVVLAWETGMLLVGISRCVIRTAPRGAPAPCRSRPHRGRHERLGFPSPFKFAQKPYAEQAKAEQANPKPRHTTLTC